MKLIDAYLKVGKQFGNKQTSMNILSFMVSKAVNLCFDPNLRKKNAGVTLLSYLLKKLPKQVFLNQLQNIIKAIYFVLHHLPSNLKLKMT